MTSGRPAARTLPTAAAPSSAERAQLRVCRRIPGIVSFVIPSAVRRPPSAARRPSPRRREPRRHHRPARRHGDGAVHGPAARWFQGVPSRRDRRDHRVPAVSSTGHLTVTGRLLDLREEAFDAFAIAIQAGAVLAVLSLYWRRVLGLVTAAVHSRAPERDVCSERCSRRSLPPPSSASRSSRRSRIGSSVSDRSRSRGRPAGSG